MPFCTPQEHIHSLTRNQHHKCHFWAREPSFDEFEARKHNEHDKELLEHAVALLPWRVLEGAVGTNLGWFQPEETHLIYSRGTICVNASVETVSDFLLPKVRKGTTQHLIPDKFAILDLSRGPNTS
eukprot:c17917_g1_i1.p1 GENE.c17917_g1_i1~~c17917_g1_i1.p1  ORF type:complete len:126 (-),score=4.69 c17917_g1_i1:70-447(-)